MAGLQKYINSLKEIGKLDDKYRLAASLLEEQTAYAEQKGNKHTDNFRYDDHVMSSSRLENYAANESRGNNEYNDEHYYNKDAQYSFTNDSSIISDKREDGAPAKVESDRFKQFHTQYKILAQAKINATKMVALNIYSDEAQYAPNVDITTPSEIGGRIANKSMQNYTFSSDEDGKALSLSPTDLYNDAAEQSLRFDTEPTIAAGEIPVVRLIRGMKFGATKTLANYDYITRDLPELSRLAQLNPRFNRHINPLYFLGTEPASTSAPFLDTYKDKDDTSVITQKNSQIVSSFPQHPLTANETTKYLVPADDMRSPKQYSDLVKPVSQLGYETYWDSILPSLKRKGSEILDKADGVVDAILGQAGLDDVSKVIKVATGVDPLLIKENLVNEAQEFLSSDSEDIFYATKYGLTLGQVAGHQFKTVLQGFSNSDPSQLARKGDQGWSVYKEIQRILGSDKKWQEEDYTGAYLPYTDPTKYSIKDRMKYGGNAKPDEISVLKVFNQAINIFGNTGASDPVSAIIDKITTNVKDEINKIIDIADKTFDLGKLSLNGLSVNDFLTDGDDKYFLTRYEPTQSTTNEIEVWDTTIDAVIEGPEEVDKRAPFIAAERFRAWVGAMPHTQHAKWNIVDNERIFEKSSSFISNLTLERFGNEKVPNIKQDQQEKVFVEKATAAVNDHLIFEGTQQASGKFNGVAYGEGDQLFTPLAATFEQEATYLTHVKSSRIDSLLNTTRGIASSYDVAPESMAASEMQYFPFYVRTISRDDFAITQQPYYQNGAVFMSQKRVTGSSIVFLEAAFDGGITQTLANSIDRDQYMGRTDPVLLWKSASRTIGFSFNLYSAQPSDVVTNQNKMNSLMQMALPQLQTINEIGSIGPRRGPMVEVRIGDMFLLYGMIENISIDHGAESNVWEILPGGRVLRDHKVTMSLALVHTEQPGAHFNFFSPTFKPQIFKPSVNGQFVSP